MRGIWNWASVGQTLMCSGTCFGMLANILTFLVAWSQNACIYLKYVPPEVCVNFVISLLWKWYAPIPGSAVSFRQSKDILTKLGWLISWSSEAALRLPGRTNTRLLSKLMNLSNLVDHLLCKTLYFCNQAWFNWILLGNPCPVTATKEPRFRVRSVLDPAGHGEHPETPMDLPWSRFSNFQPLKHEDIPTQYEDASNTLEAQFCSRS